MARKIQPDLYFSVDVETDGPIPGPFSLVSIGISCVASFDGLTLRRRDPRADTFYAELRPISDQFQPDALAVSGLTREHLIEYGRRPQDVMPELADWVGGLADGHKAVFVAYPLSFDWMWFYWYAVSFGREPGQVKNSPFGFSNALDMKSMYAAKARVPLSRSTKRSMPKHLLSRAPHTHNALDDAVEQGELFCNLHDWAGAGSA